MKKIKKENKIGEVIKDHPQVVEVFLRFGLFCVGCPASEHESIEEGAMVHGKGKDEIEKLIEELNKVLST
jgi:hybrid cluster-associated redox disulfide protein